VTVDQELFREIMSGFPTGVTIVTTFDDDGAPKGLTVSAFCPVSLDPPLILVCVDKRSTTLPVILGNQHFTVNFLAAGRDELARSFATPSPTKFDGVPWTRPSLDDAGPVLHEDSAAHVACRLHQAIEAGDHWILIGSVEDGAIDHAETPLLYGKRTYAAWVAQG
jgi:3-hydroxy-9,10-secoandrosta-1,3,5(10)-triene-9,17-dione monooxygenase reductase component